MFGGGYVPGYTAFGSYLLAREIQNWAFISIAKLDKKIKKVAAGIIKPSKTDVQVIIGPLVEFVANEMKRL